MSFRPLYIISFFFIFNFHCGFGQDSLKTFVACASCDNELRNFVEKRSRQPGVNGQRLLFDLQLMGYLESALDSVESSGKTEIVVHPGPRYEWERLIIEGAPDHMTGSIGQRNFSAGRSFEYDRIFAAVKKILAMSENQGRPFARLEFDSVAMQDQKVYARLQYEPGPEITFDTLKIKSDGKVSPVFLAAFLNIRPGSLYDQRKVNEIPERIRNLPFLELELQPRITFQNETAIAHLHLQSLPSNRFEGVIGLAPNESAGGNLLVTGQVDLDLNNLFRSGKTLKLRWQRLKAASQYLDLNYFHPNLLQSPIHFSLDFNLLKEDSAYVDRNFTVRAGYDINPRTSVSFLSNYNSASVLQEQETADGLGNYRWISYGGELNWQDLDRMILPTKGTSFHLKGLFGNKTIQAESEKLLQVASQVSFKRYTPLLDRLVLFKGFSSGIIQSDRLFTSDLFRLGGANDLRGFTENELFVSHFALLNLELRYFFESQSYFMVLFDQAYARNSVSGMNDFPSGAGLGLALRTGPGFLKLIYATGRTDQQPFSLNYSKLHFGFESLF